MPTVTGWRPGSSTQSRSFAVEACTGWRYVAEELAAGIEVYLAEPADNATLCGKKQRARTDRTDARLQRTAIFAQPASPQPCRRAPTLLVQLLFTAPSRPLGLLASYP
jgi:hypothetical protein